MALTDSDGNSYQDMADYHMQYAENNQTQSDVSVFNKVIQKESNWKGERTGSNVGLGQWGPPERKEFGITDPMNVEQNYKALGQERARNERYLSEHGYQGKLDTAGKVGLMHQQGIGGGTAIMMADPNATMGDVLGKFYKNPKLLNEAISQKAGWGDVRTPVGQWREHAMAYYEGGSPVPHLQATLDRPHIDREHDVPLLAAGLMDNSGNLYGTAIDRRIPAFMDLQDDAGNKATIDSSKFVHLHEMAEVNHMENNLLPGGMKSSEAYTKAHNEVATPREQAAVEKWASEHGLEPSSTWKNYQKFWTNQLKVADREPEKVHPDTYLHPYDGHPQQKKMEELSGRTIADHPQMAGKEAIGKKPDVPPRQQQTRTKGLYADNEKKMDDLSQGLVKDKSPFGGLLDLMEEEEKAHGPIPKSGPERQAWLKNLMNDPRAKEIGDQFGSLGGIMAGPKGFAQSWLSKLFQGDNLQRAKRMLSKGMSDQEIFEQTGMHLGPEGTWRKEISDVNSKWLGGKNLPQEHMDSAGSYYHLDDLMGHDELFKAYPDLRNVKVRIGKTTPGAAASAGGDEVTIQQSFIQRLQKERGWDDQQVQTYLHSIMLHELQHIVQDYEGMVQGGGGEFGSGDEAAYHRNAGEVEARNVQRRWESAINEKIKIAEIYEPPPEWTSVGTKVEVEDKLHRMNPVETEDVPRAKQSIVMHHPLMKVPERVQENLSKRYRGASDIYRR